MSNPHLAQIHALRQNARRFWAAWQAEEARLAQLGDIAFVEQANDLLHQFCPDCIVELDGIAPDSDDLLGLVFFRQRHARTFPTSAGLGGIDTNPALSGSRVPLAARQRCIRFGH